MPTTPCGIAILGFDGDYMAELSIIVPTYNESKNVVALVAMLDDALTGIAWEVVFVDDDSPDGTSELVRGLAQNDSRVRLIQRIGRKGLSRAVIEGMLSTSAAFIAVMDADHQHDERILPVMLQRLKDENFDVVVGSRYIQGGSVGKWDETRQRISKTATRLGQILVGKELSDPMSGFFVLRREVVDSAIRRLSGRGFKILLDIISSAPGKLHIGEVPFTFRERAFGESKLGYGVVLEFLLMLLHKYFNRLMPLQFVLFCMVGASGVAVHLGTLWLAHREFGQDFMLSQTIATLVAMTSNYALNNEFTYRDRKRRGLDWLTGLLSFYAVCGLGVIANVGVAGSLFLREGWLIAAFAGTVVGVMWNYIASKSITWGSR